MIRRIALRNFRAFKNCEFPFSRINIFVGPNNSGKSSALSAINVIAQSVKDSQTGSPITLRGKYQDLGTYIDVVHGGVPRTVMGLDIDIQEFSFRVDFKYRTVRKDIEVQRYEILYNGLPLFYYKSAKDKYDLKYNGRPIESYITSGTKRRPDFSGFMLDDPNIRQISTHVDKPQSKFIGVSQEEFRELVRVQQLIFRARRYLAREFDRFDSLSPFRAPPERTFLFSGETPNEVGKDGAKAVDMLVADSFTRGSMNKRILDGVCDWFKATGMANELAVKPLTSRHFEIVVVSDDGEHNLCDVGFGCSQVLPVLVGGLNLFLRQDIKRLAEPMYMVQEPEIHLHPNAQAELGSFFSKLCQDGGQIFLETHSDNLILRLQQHIANGDLKGEDVKIFFIRNGEAGKKEVTELNLNEEGIFDKEMPGGFFPQRQKESLALAKAAAAHRRRVGGALSAVEKKQVLEAESSSVAIQVPAKRKNTNSKPRRGA